VEKSAERREGRIWILFFDVENRDDEDGDGLNSDDRLARNEGVIIEYVLTPFM